MAYGRDSLDPRLAIQNEASAHVVLCVLLPHPCASPPSMEVLSRRTDRGFSVSVFGDAGELHSLAHCIVNPRAQRQPLVIAEFPCANDLDGNHSRVSSGSLVAQSGPIRNDIVSRMRAAVPARVVVEVTAHRSRSTEVKPDVLILFAHLRRLEESRVANGAVMECAGSNIAAQRRPPRGTAATFRRPFAGSARRP